MTREAMVAPFAEEELHQFKGRGGFVMTYIEDETVMDRLDLGYGPGNWTINVEAVPYAEGVVKVRLGIRDSGDWVWYEDFGYPNQKDGDTLKESVSDGIRRCGRYVGIARDLYRKRTYATGGPVTVQRPYNPPTRNPIEEKRAERAQTAPEPPRRPELERRADGLVGTITKGSAPVDLQYRTEITPGPAFGFKLKAGKTGYQAVAIGELADALAVAQAAEDMEGITATVWGRIEMVPWQKDGKDMPPYARIAVERVQTPGWTLPAVPTADAEELHPSAEWNKAGLDR